MRACMYVMDDAGNWVPLRQSLLGIIAQNTGSAGEPINQVPPAITGGKTVGATLTATKGVWYSNPTGETYAYQWKRSGTNISGATSASYTLVDADEGDIITCAVTATNTSGSTTATSNGIGPIAGAPKNTAAPSITGTATEGETLTASNGTWEASPTPTYTYQWLRDDEAIPGATASTYELVQDDVGAVIKVKVTATNQNGSASATSDGTSEVEDGAPVNTVAPAITGTAKEGEELSASTGTWTSTPTPTYAYQWLADDVAIDGATAATYTLTEAEVGAVITVTVTATTALGSASATSDGTAEVTAAE